jgi:hypothetical protein
MITKATAEDVSALNKSTPGIVASIQKGWTTEANILEGSRTNEVELIEIIADTKTRC